MAVIDFYNHYFVSAILAILLRDTVCRFLIDILGHANPAKCSSPYVFFKIDISCIKSSNHMVWVLEAVCLEQNDLLHCI
jgi:hypothetical protein